MILKNSVTEAGNDCGGALLLSIYLKLLLYFAMYNAHFFLPNSLREK